MNKATGPTAVIAEDEPVLSRTLCRLLQQVWPELQIVGAAEDGIRATELALEYTSRESSATTLRRRTPQSVIRNVNPCGVGNRDPGSGELSRHPVVVTALSSSPRQRQRYATFWSFPPSSGAASTLDFRRSTPTKGKLRMRRSTVATTDTTGRRTCHRGLRDTDATASHRTPRMTTLTPTRSKRYKADKMYSIGGVDSGVNVIKAEQRRSDESRGLSPASSVHRADCSRSLISDPTRRSA